LNLLVFTDVLSGSDLSLSIKAITHWPETDACSAFALVTGTELNMFNLAPATGARKKSGTGKV